MSLVTSNEIIVIDDNNMCVKRLAIRIVRNLSSKLGGTEFFDNKYSYLHSFQLLSTKTIFLSLI